MVVRFERIQGLPGGELEAVREEGAAGGMSTAIRSRRGANGIRIRMLPPPLQNTSSSTEQIVVYLDQ
jgi:hypothetical protein